ncbi:hypothetical protein DTO207G8_6343 [Paecilomyces variotii]|nr:hypothetical protein DTO169E5_7212 [Paecilomyces variotii]KAJ9250030.1 hypothetical protein DTO207G8_6343 [Paecilomyces variotii]
MTEAQTTAKAQTNNINGWDGPDDPTHPRNWPTVRKWIITVITSLMTFSVTFASSVFSTAETPTAEKFHVSHEVMVLGLSLFVLGYSFGPLLWGPLSEVCGRKFPLMLGVIVFCIFQIPVAVAQNVQTVIVCRFIGGIFACAPLAIVGASLSDIWDPVQRGIAACIYSGATFSGPVLGPIVGGFLVNSHLGWRWTAWITLIQGVFFWVLGMLCVPETHAPTLLRRKLEAVQKVADESARRGSIRRMISPGVNPQQNKITLRIFVTKYLTRPLVMLVSEPILLLTTLYMSLVYGTLYLFFEAYPISFQEQRGWNPGVGALPFLGITVGVVFGNITIAATTLFRFKRKYLEGGNKVAPEERLIPMMIGAVVLPPGLFWFAWTSNPHITWVPQVIAGVPIGMGIQIIYTMGFNYILDAYTPYAASAVSANTFIRSMAAAGFPLFATPMYHKLGISWATSLLAFFSLLLMPFLGELSRRYCLVCLGLFVLFYLPPLSGLNIPHPMAPHGRRRSSASVASLFSSPMLMTVIFPFLLFLVCFPVPAAAVGSAVLGIDLGTEYIKAALVKPGIPLEIVLTKDSKRKESAAVAFKPAREGNAPFPERFYGGDALALAARFPDDVYSNLKTLLGVPFNGGEEEMVQVYKSRYPSINLESAPGDRGTVGVRSGKLGQAVGKDAFLVEELLAMQLKQIKANADVMAGKGSNVRDVIITYPPFYTAEEKRSVELAAKLAGLNVEALISDGLAVGLNYATSRAFPSVSDGQKPEYHVVYDMGAGSATATVLRFQSRKVKDVGKFNKTVQEVHVIAAGWDRTLGGDALNQLIVNDMIEKLVQEKKHISAADIRAHGKTMARLWKDAEKVRQILSANTETGTSFEGLFEEDLYFKYKITRSEFEKLAAEHVNRVGGPLEQALSVAGIPLSDIESVILHGGTIRTPFVQKQLEKVAGGSSKLRTNVNADESAVFGAAFKGAALSPSFRVKDIRAVDAAQYPVFLKWPADGKERQQKLFTPTSQVGVEKQVTVKNLDDFEFSFYQQVPKGQDAIDAPVLKVETKNLTASVAELKNKFGCSPANITTKFAVRLSPVDGLPEVLSGSASCEVDSAKKASVVDDVKGFFGLGSKKDAQQPLKEDDEPTESVTLEPESSSTETATSETSTSTEPAKDAKKASPEPQTKLEIIPVKLVSSPLGTPAPSPAELNRILERLAAFDASDRDRVLREEALNELESFIYRGRDLLEDEEFLKALKQDQVSVLKEKLSASSDWLYEDGADAKTKDFQEKLKALKDIIDPALRRKQENALRPSKMTVLEEMLKSAGTISEMMEQTIKAEEEAFSSSLAAASSSSTTEASSETSTSADSSSTESSSTDAFADLEEDPYSTSSSTTTTASTALPSKPASPSYSLYTPADLSSLTKTYESTKTWFETQSVLQAKLTESDDPALPVAEIDARLRELERILSRIGSKIHAGGNNGNSEGSSSKKNGKKNNKKDKKQQQKQDKEEKKSRKDEL